MESEYLHPGDKVRIIEDSYENEDIWVNITVTVDSVGKIISFEEYCDSIRKRHSVKKPETFYAEHFSIAEQRIKNGKCYPVRIEKYAPVSDTVIDYWGKKGWDVHMNPYSNVHLLDAGSLVKTS